MEKQYYVYMMASRRNGTIYIGMTSDLKRRAWEHRSGIVEGFTKKYDIKKLVYFEAYNIVEEAILRERRLKKWNRVWKIRLIEKTNQDWNDLYDTI